MEKRIHELSSVCEASNAKVALRHLLENASQLLSLESSSNNSTLSEEDFATASSLFLQKQQQQKQQQDDASMPSSILHPLLFGSMLRIIAETEKDTVLSRALQSLSYLKGSSSSGSSSNSNSSSSSSSSRGAQSTGGGSGSKVAKAKKKEMEDLSPTELSSELLKFLNLVVQQADLRTLLVLIKLLLSLWEARKDLSKLRVPMPLWKSLMHTNVLAKRDFERALSREKEMIRLKTFESVARILLHSGKPSKLTQLEVQGKAVGIVNGISIKPLSSERYFEVTLKGGSKISGVRIGWTVCDADVSTSANGGNAQLGDSNDCWVYDGMSGFLFHNAKAIREARKAAEAAQLEAKRLEEEERAAAAAKAKENERAESKSTSTEETKDEGFVCEEKPSMESTASALGAESSISAVAAATSKEGESSSSSSSSGSSSTPAVAAASEVPPPPPPPSLSSFPPAASASLETALSSLSSLFHSSELQQPTNLPLSSLLGLAQSRLAKSSQEGESSKGEEETYKRSLSLSLAASLRQRVDKINGEPDKVKNEALANGGTYLGIISEADLFERGWTNGTVLGCYLNTDSGLIKFFVNGVEVGSQSNALNISEQFCERGVCPAFSCSEDVGLEFNIGQTPYAFQPPLQNTVTPTASKQTLSLINDSRSSFLRFDSPLLHAATSVEVSAEGASPPSAPSPPPSLAGSGIIVENVWKERVNGLTFEASVRFTDVEFFSTATSPRETLVEGETSTVAGEGAAKIEEETILWPLDPASMRVLFSCAREKAEEDSMCIFVDRLGRLGIFIEGLARDIFTPPKTIKLDTWQHVAVIYPPKNSSTSSNTSRYLLVLIDGIQVTKAELPNCTIRLPLDKVTLDCVCIGGRLALSGGVVGVSPISSKMSRVDAQENHSEESIKSISGEPSSSSTSAEPPDESRKSSEAQMKVQPIKREISITPLSSWVGDFCEARLWIVSFSADNVLSSLG